MTTSFSDAGNAASWKQDGKTVHQLSQYFLLHIIWAGGWTAAGGRFALALDKSRLLR
jgi:hypothetical protein